MRNTREIKIGNVKIGGNNPIAIQSMITVPLTDTEKAIRQIIDLENAGCEIVRAAIPDNETADAIKTITENIHIPFVADIQFDYRLAIRSIESGVSKLRINPGNIGGKNKVNEVVACLKEYEIPVRIGVNSGSLEKDILQKYGHPSAEALVESAKRNIDYFNEFGYDDLVVSIKSSDVVATYQANQIFASLYNYPLHLGVTEAGANINGIIRSSVGIGALLLNEIGDTIRVSLTGEPVQEVFAAKEILSACNLREEGVRIVSCPTCARCHTDLLKIVTDIKDRTRDIKYPITVAVMGCGVNGPGEAKEADIGIACGDGKGVLFKKGSVIKSIPTDEMIETLYEEIMLFMRDEQRETK